MQQNGKVWILSPFKLNTYSVSKLTKLKKDFNLILGATKLENEGSIFNEKGEIRIARIMTKYYKMQCDKEESLYPLAIYPVHLDERMAAQQACFTIFGNVIKGLEDIDLQEKFTESIYIDSDSKIKILLELKQLGISYYSIYPDLDGLGKAINLEHSSEVFDLEWENDWNYNLM
ncbi:hypothetical protein EON73_02230 [bacterium]|nr:MAG: hypothetical protein EON73_02230 [bacterium]